MTVKTITDLSQLEDLFADSYRLSVFVLKHSLACGISSAAHREFLRFAGSSSARSGICCAVIEIQPSRAVSEALAERTGVGHASPQVLLLREGIAVWQASHWQITQDSLVEATSTA